VTFHTTSNYVFAHMFFLLMTSVAKVGRWYSKGTKGKENNCMCGKPNFRGYYKKHPLLQSNKHFPYNEACVIEIREEIDIALVENLQVMINHPLPTQDPNLY